MGTSNDLYTANLLIVRGAAFEATGQGAASAATTNGRQPSTRPC